MRVRNHLFNPIRGWRLPLPVILRLRRGLFIFPNGIPTGEALRASFVTITLPRFRGFLETEIASIEVKQRTTNGLPLSLFLFRPVGAAVWWVFFSFLLSPFSLLLFSLYLIPFFSPSNVLTTIPVKTIFTVTTRASYNGYYPSFPSS